MKRRWIQHIVMTDEAGNSSKIVMVMVAETAEEAEAETFRILRGVECYRNRTFKTVFRFGERLSPAMERLLREQAG